MCFLRGNVVDPVVHANDSSFEIISVRVATFASNLGLWRLWFLDQRFFLAEPTEYKNVVVSNEPLHWRPSRHHFHKSGPLRHMSIWNSRCPGAIWPQYCRCAVLMGKKQLNMIKNDQIETAETYAYYMYIYIRTRNIYREICVCLDGHSRWYSPFQLSHHQPWSFSSLLIQHAMFHRWKTQPAIPGRFFFRNPCRKIEEKCPFWGASFFDSLQS